MKKIHFLLLSLLLALCAADLFAAVFRVVGDGGDGLELVAAHAVVEHDIRKNTDVRRMKGAYRLKIFFFRPVFGADRPFLIELSEIIHIINAVTYILLGDPLVGRR